MNSKTAKLIRKVAKTAPYGNTGFDEEETKYTMKGTTILLAPGVRLTEKLLKKYYKQGKFTTEDLRQGLLAENA